MPEAEISTEKEPKVEHAAKKQKVAKHQKVRKVSMHKNHDAGLYIDL